MLNIVFGRENAPEGYVLDTRVYFKRHQKLSWFEDPFVQKIAFNIGGNKHVMKNVFEAPNGNLITEDKLPTGCKTLCCIYFEENNEKYFYGSAMGDNCVTFLMDIARNKNINIFLEHFMDIPGKYFEEGIVYVNHKVVTEWEYEDLYSRWCESAR